MKREPIKFIELESGCFIPMNKRLNKDGYFRKRWADGIEMFHRFIWKARRGPIPEGYEINHLCRNRACQNVDHMECIPGLEHTIKTNIERYAHIREEAKKEWLKTRCKPSQLYHKYGTNVYKWVKKWRAELES